MPGDSGPMRVNVLLEELEKTQLELQWARSAMLSGMEPPPSLRDRVVHAVELLNMVHVVPDRECRRLYVEVASDGTSWTTKRVEASLDLLERGISNLRHD